MDYISLKLVKKRLRYGDGLPLFLLGETIISPEDAKTIDPGTIEKVDVFRTVDYAREYGPQAINGVVFITLKE